MEKRRFAPSCEIPAPDVADGQHLLQEREGLCCIAEQGAGYGATAARYSGKVFAGADFFVMNLVRRFLH
jgi:hypothetical protein